MTDSQTKIGIFGGSGLSTLFEKKLEKKVETRYVKPSAPIELGTLDEKLIAFMPRHGQNHTIPPHKVPYKSNVGAFKEIGVERIIAPCAAGSLQSDVKPGDFVICDQLVDRTHGREDTFFHGPEVMHAPFADPYCPELRKLAIEACEKLGLPYHKKGTVVVINGPRFSTRAESRSYSSQGWEVINMTQYPESVLAKEQQMCYLNISVITDYDAGLEGNSKVKPVTSEEVVKRFTENKENVKSLLREIIKNMPEKRSCDCDSSMANAEI
jgi:5'-methylthioadenosine phosphorylase